MYKPYLCNPLSPVLFLYTEINIQDIQDKGLKINRQFVSNLLFTDDIILIVEIDENPENINHSTRMQRNLQKSL